MSGFNYIFFLFKLFVLQNFLNVSKTKGIFDAKVYLINLKEREDKLESSKFQLNLLGLNFTVVEAENGFYLKSLDYKKMTESFLKNKTGVEDLKITLLNITQSNRSPGQIGCWLSHLKTLNKIINSNDSLSLILEDDFVADGNAISLVNKYIHLLSKEKNWDLLYVGHCDSPSRCKKFLDKKKSICLTETRIYCTHAYLIKNKSVAKKIFNAGNLIKPVNADYFFDKANIKRYVVFPHIFKQRKNIKADINSRGGIYDLLLNNTIEQILETKFK